MSDSIRKNWVELAEYDLETARAMLESKRFLYVIFMCQQSIEKLLKSGYVKKFDKTPPRIHNLVRLSEYLFDKNINQEQQSLFELLNSYYIESRYTEDINEMLEIVDNDKAREILEKTKGLFEWLKSRI